VICFLLPLVGLGLNACTPAASATWRLTPATTTEGEIEKLQGLLRDAGYEAGSVSEACQSSKEPCYLTFTPPQAPMAELEIAWRGSDTSLEITYTELFSSQFSEVGSHSRLIDLSHQLERAFGDRLKLVYPRTLPN
jgi:hypothetical protein